MRTDPNVEKLVAHAIRRIGQNATPDLVLEALTKGKVTDVPRPSGTNLDAVAAFRKRSIKVRRRIIAQGFVLSKQVSLKDIEAAETVPTPNSSTYEKVEHDGKTYVTLRSVCAAQGKRSENVGRRLQRQGFTLLQLTVPNVDGHARMTPCVPEEQVPRIEAVLATGPKVSGRKGWVYFVQQGRSGPIKIGWSLNPGKRFGALQVDNPTTLCALGTVPGQTLEDEQKLLDEFGDLRVQGEWFRPETRLLRRIRQLVGRQKPEENQLVVEHPERETSGMSRAPTELARVETVQCQGHAFEFVWDSDGEAYVTLRCFRNVIGTRHDALKRTLRSQGYDIRNIHVKNVRGESRQTPCIHADHVLAVIACANFAGMRPAARNFVLAVRKELPAIAVRYASLKAASRGEVLETPAPPRAWMDKVTEVVASFVSKTTEAVTSIVEQFAHRLDIRLDRIERLLTHKPAPAIATTNGAPQTPKYPTPPNKYGFCKPFLSGVQMLDRLDQALCREQRNLGIDSPEAIEQLARNLGIFKTQHWGRDIDGEWQYDGSKEALSSYSHMLDFLSKSIVARNSQPTPPS